MKVTFKERLVLAWKVWKGDYDSSEEKHYEQKRKKRRFIDILECIIECIIELI